MWQFYAEHLDKLRIKGNGVEVEDLANRLRGEQNLWVINLQDFYFYANPFRRTVNEQHKLVVKFSFSYDFIAVNCSQENICSRVHGIARCGGDLILLPSHIVS